MQIMKCLNGNISIGDIINYISNLYSNVDYELVKRDVIDVLYKLTKVEGIEWNGENPFMASFLGKIDNRYSIVLSTYKERSNIVNYIKNNQDKNNYYNPYINYFDFEQEILLDSTYTFIISNENSKISGVLFFKKISNTIINLTACIFNKEIVNVYKYINYAINTISKINNNNVRYYRVYTTDIDSNFINEELSKLEFEETITLKNELGKDINIIEWNLVN